METKIYDLLIIGGGPCGLACGIEAQKAGLEYLIVEKGSIAESIRRYPIHMTFFSTAENIEIGGVPFSIADAKATRTEALQYYRKVSEHYHLNIRLFTEVTQVKKQENSFQIQTHQNEIFQATNIVFATGYFDVPRVLNIPGEHLPHVSKYYDEPFRYVHTDVVIVGGGNSAVSAALELYRHGVKVNMLVRKSDFKPTAKYWLIPDLKNRIKEGKIQANFNTVVQEIHEKQVIVQNTETGEQIVYPADFVFLLIGYTPDVAFLKSIGVNIKPNTLEASFDKKTFQTNVEGVYLAGTIAAGIFTERIFIENGRHDGKKIVQDILHKKELEKSESLT